MWFYVPEWLKFWNRKNEEDQKLSDLIKKRAEEQNAVLDKAKIEAAEVSQYPKVAEKDYFE
jgi:hypothetical protein